MERRELFIAEIIWDDEICSSSELFHDDMLLLHSNRLGASVGKVELRNRYRDEEEEPDSND